MCAASDGNTEIIQQLVTADADLNLQNNVCQYIETKLCSSKLYNYICSIFTRAFV